MERLTQAIFEAAIREGRCEALYNALCDGGGATVDAISGVLHIIDADTLNGMVE